MEKEPFGPFSDEPESQGGNTLGGEEMDRQIREVIDLSRMFSKEELGAIAKVGEVLTEHIDGIDPVAMTQEEYAKTRYYRYSLAVSLMGESRERYLMLNALFGSDPFPDLRDEPDIHYLELG